MYYDAIGKLNFFKNIKVLVLKRVRVNMVMYYDLKFAQNY